MLIRKRRGWEIPERDTTSEDTYLNRRAVLRGMGVTTVGLSGLAAGCGVAESVAAQIGRAREYEDAVVYPTGPAGDLYPPAKSAVFTEENAGRPITAPGQAHAWNNFYEFFTPKDEVWEHVDNFVTEPWTIEISGHVDKPGTYDLEDLMRKLPVEERVYRFRCVEAWSAVIPWCGIPMRALVDHVQPQSRATHVAMYTANRPDQMPGIPAQSWYPWPYFEGLTMAEARNELTMLATGSYGKPQPKQNGAPIRLLTPWKFGFKSIKSIDRIVFTDKQPPTFWNKVSASEYGFWANINPEVPHPRWSQATERFINTGSRVPTQIYNGYGEWVAEMYAGMEKDLGVWLYR